MAGQGAVAAGAVVTGACAAEPGRATGARGRRAEPTIKQADAMANLALDDPAAAALVEAGDLSAGPEKRRSSPGDPSAVAGAPAVRRSLRRRFAPELCSDFVGCEPPSGSRIAGPRTTKAEFGVVGLEGGCRRSVVGLEGEWRGRRPGSVSRVGCSTRSRWNRRRSARSARTSASTWAGAARRGRACAAPRGIRTPQHLHRAGAGPAEPGDASRRVAIGQSPLIVQTPAGNVMWDCIPFVDDGERRAAARGSAGWPRSPSRIRTSTAP